jgi:hypothetical protein
MLHLQTIRSDCNWCMPRDLNVCENKYKSVFELLTLSVDAASEVAMQ